MRESRPQVGWEEPKSEPTLNLSKNESVEKTTWVGSLKELLANGKERISDGVQVFFAGTLIVLGIGIFFILIALIPLYYYHNGEMKNLKQSYEEKLDNSKISYNHLLLFLKEKDVNSMADVTATLSICEDHNIEKASDDPLVQEKMSLNCIDAFSKIKIQVNR